jgi:hypothetical protein
MADQPSQAVDAALRPSGTASLGPIPSGAHFCLFHKRPQDLIEACADFFRARPAE